MIRILFIMKVLSTLFVFLLFSCCSLHRLLNDDALVERQYRTSDKTILNYEDASRKYLIKILNTHYRLHVEIEKPYVIKSVLKSIDDIYKISGIEGVTIFLAEIDASGKIISYDRRSYRPPTSMPRLGSMTSP